MKKHHEFPNLAAAMAAYAAAKAARIARREAAARKPATSRPFSGLRAAMRAA